jgi:hypothetical protein
VVGFNVVGEFDVDESSPAWSARTVSLPAKTTANNKSAPKPTILMTPPMNGLIEKAMDSVTPLTLRCINNDAA